MARQNHRRHHHHHYHHPDHPERLVVVVVDVVHHPVVVEGAWEVEDPTRTENVLPERRGNVPKHWVRPVSKTEDTSWPFHRPFHRGPARGKRTGRTKGPAGQGRTQCSFRKSGNRVCQRTVDTVGDSRRGRVPGGHPTWDTDRNIVRELPTRRPRCIPTAWTRGRHPRERWNTWDSTFLVRNDGKRVPEPSFPRCILPWKQRPDCPSRVGTIPPCTEPHLYLYTK
mmetsp:Transcript_17409/g.40454  ORF Transcript_17409/g.40454 Transcript_17409/m.40454 type:complete len:225 (-) Transcript_17409:301-975(-)